MTARRRVLLIGIDAATFDLLGPWAAQGHLPNLARLLSTGSSGQLASTLQPITAPAWVTCLTGVNQGRHGLFDFIRRRPNSYSLEVTNASHVGAPTMFELLSRAGLRVISVNVPYTYPPRSVNGVVIGGPFATAVSPDLVHPQSIFSTLLKVVPDYFVLPNYNPRAPAPLADFSELLLREVDQRERIAQHLLRTEPWDLAMVVFMATDEVQHSFWAAMHADESDPMFRYRDTIRTVYERVDRAIGTLQDVAIEDGDGEPTVVIMSDHGAGPFRATVNLNHWLAHAGFFEFRSDTASAILRPWSKFLRSMAHTYRRQMPGRFRSLLRTALGSGNFNELKGRFESALMSAGADWRRTRAYSIGVGGNIYVNQRGREPNGIVAPGAEYEALCADIIYKLRALKDPETGVAVVKDVHRRTEVYSGAYLSQAPDLIVEWADYAYWGRSSFDDPAASIFQPPRQFEFSEQPLTGTHRMHGVFIAAGPGVRTGVTVKGARLVDIAPSVLALLGVKPDAPFDGRIISEAMVADTIDSPRVTVESVPVPGAERVYNPEETHEITEHLRSLGYL